MFQFFVGEIGIQWKEYLYELSYWHLILIARGYLMRSHTSWEQSRLIAYHAAFAFGGSSNTPTVDEWITFPWEKHDRDEIRDEDIEAIRAKIREENKNRQAN